jgi:hypothetical protein
MYITLPILPCFPHNSTAEQGDQIGPYIWPLFWTVQIMFEFCQKMWVAFWAIFTQTHLVTLPLSQSRSPPSPPQKRNPLVPVRPLWNVVPDRPLGRGLDQLGGLRVLLLQQPVHRLLLVLLSLNLGSMLRFLKYF